MCSAMDQLTFVPASGQFFLWTPADPASGDDESDLAAALQAVGWPTAARICGDSPDGHQADGFLIELIDALPILAGASVHELEQASPAIAVWAAAARMALDLVVQGQLSPRLLPRRYGHGDERVAGWEARWMAALSSPSVRSKVAQLAQALPGSQVAVLINKGRPSDPGPGPGDVPGWSPRQLVRRLLDACADMLVREAARRGVYVRLGGWPADTWEQRLVRGLVDDRASFCVKDPDPQLLARELKDWTEDQLSCHESPALLGEMASPPSWKAGEPLQQVVRRMTGQAAQLASRLADGEPAPRTLSPASPLSTSRLNQSVAVTRALLQLVGSSAARRKQAVGQS